jgi:glycerol-3-phosphate acyltransferase PlsY
MWLNFKGGKGVATFIGVLLAIDWKAALAYGGIWLVLAGIFRYSSVAALAACLATPVILFSLGKIEAALLFALLAALVWYKHRANIGRLFAGTEPKIGASK